MNACTWFQGLDLKFFWMGWDLMSPLTWGPMSHIVVKRAWPIGPHGGSYDPDQPDEKYFSLECLL